MRRRIAGYCCTISRASRSIPRSIAYLRQRHGCDAAAFAASRSSWGPYLALGYKLARLREKLERAGEPA